MTIIDSVFMSVALFIQNAKRMHRVALSPVACLAVPYISTLCHKDKILEKKIIEHKMCFVFGTTCFLKYFSLREEMSEI
jgi:hypothetical protein